MIKDEELSKLFRLAQGARKILNDETAKELFEEIENEHFRAFVDLPIDATYDEMKVVQLSSKACRNFRMRLQKYIDDYGMIQKRIEEDEKVSDVNI